MAITYNEDGSVRKTKGNKKPFIQRVFSLPYDTLDVYKKLKKHKNRTNQTINDVNK